MVTVDSTSSHFRILWNEPTLNIADTVYLYKEGTVAGQPIRMAGFSVTGPGEYVDEQSNPAVKTEWYFLNVVDKCSHEYTGSGHMPVHLAINQGVGNTWNLIWSDYFGAPVLTYNIYRGTTANNLQLLTSVSGGITQFTDLYAPAGDIYYQIEALLDVVCSISKLGTPSYSNLARYAPHGFMDDRALSGFSIRNNPVTDYFNIDDEKLSAIAGISLLSLNGKQLIAWQNPSTSTFDISGISSGIYLLKIELKDKHQSFMQKLVIL
jgi:hypothetical protein